MATTQEEYPVPVNPFWDDIRYPTARSILQAFAPDDDAEKLPIDSKSKLSSHEKLELLHTLLRNRLSQAEASSAPDTLLSADYETWYKIHTAIFSAQKDLGDAGAAETTLRTLFENRRDKENISLLQSLHWMLLERGSYEEVVEQEPRVVEWLDGRLGKNSPQALGSRRMMAEALWRLGRTAEAEARFGEIRELVQCTVVRMLSIGMMRWML
ncbi:hypothetical protein NPX13_g4954 [Xylaria arbuscula]|uniref:Uncharacterized protein n=1 Tax=Xylaria arbuscula TaxID=114810 RepID=A0A9W8NEJ0_9PEZI|nr:hypothetical protein NPX13_g4954 [Xylaria arbuscula]